MSENQKKIVEGIVINDDKSKEIAQLNAKLQEMKLLVEERDEQIKKLKLELEKKHRGEKEVEQSTNCGESEDGKAENSTEINWRQDARIHKFLEKGNLESFFKWLLQRVYDTEEIENMEKTLRSLLAKYDNKDWSIESMPNCICDKFLKDYEIAVEPIDDESLDRLSKNTCGQDHTPDTLLTVAKLFMNFGDYRLASELIACTGSLALQEFIANHQLNISLNSQSTKWCFTNTLSRDIYIRFHRFSVLHELFFKRSPSARCVKYGFEDAIEFIQILRNFQITDELKKQLKEINFNDKIVLCDTN